MSDEHSSSDIIFRDGTSQVGRRSVALDPGYVSVDEHSIQDLLAFSASYANTLTYFDLKNNAAGNWSGFLNFDPADKKTLDTLGTFIETPENFAAPEYDGYRHPHFALFLTFLQLLRQIQAQLNTFTRRHLEFYYQTVLQLAPKQSRPDRVHAIVELADGQSDFLLPAGTLLSAGQDSQGADLFYSTDGNILVNQAKVASLKSAFTQIMIITPAEVRRKPELVLGDVPLSEKTDRRFVAMMQMALGFQEPRESLPNFPLGDGKPLDSQLLTSFDGLLEFIPSKLFMSVSVFRSMMEVKKELDPAVEPAKGKWQIVNGILEKAGKEKRGSAWVLSIAAPDDFQTNLNNAVGDAAGGAQPVVSFAGLPAVKTIYDLDRQYHYYSSLAATIPPRAELTALEDFIQGKFKVGVNTKGLYLSLRDFDTMMTIIDEMFEKWRRISDVLRASGRQKEHANLGFKFTSTDLRKYDADRFETLVNNSLGSLTPPTVPNQSLKTLDDLYTLIRQIEAFFSMSAENFAFIRKINQQEAAMTKPWEWEQVDAILAQARSDKDLAKKRQELEDNAKEGIEALLCFALGDPNPKNPLPKKGDGNSPSFQSLSPENDSTYIKGKLFLDETTVRFIQGVEDVVTKGGSVTDDDWYRVYKIVGQAQRRKRGWIAPTLEIEGWENLYVAEDAAKVQVSLGLKADQTTPRWRTFGDGARLDKTTASAKLGFAIASPLLALAEGTRTITVTLSFEKEGFDSTLLTSVLNETDSHGNPIIPFHFLLSTEKKIVEVLPFTDAGSRPIRVIPPDMSSVPGIPASYPCALQLTLSLSVQDPPIAPLATGSIFPTPWPVLQILLKDIEEGEGIEKKLIKRYDAFRSLMVNKVHLQVKVDGLSGLFLQNEDGILNPKKPFEPFGAMPTVGSRFLFAHPEICAKRLDTLRADIDWMGAPDNFHAYYSGYGLSDYGKTSTEAKNVTPYTDNTALKASLKLSDNKEIFTATTPAPLFNADADKTKGASKLRSLDLGPFLIEITNQYPGYDSTISLETADEAVDWNRYWVLELNVPDFQHAAYPRSAAMAASVVGTDSKPAPMVLNPPYTPKIKRLALSYEASVEIRPPTPNTAGLADQLYHVTPFGCALLTSAAVDPAAKTSPAPCFFLPQFDHAGELYLGIADLMPPQSLSLLFQVAEGSADPDLQRESVAWDYLDGNTWRSLADGQLVVDTTNGLLNSGIVAFNLTAAQSGTLMPSDLYWIRASIWKNARSVGDLVEVQAQAVSATFLDRGNAPNHLDQPLPSDTIKDLAEPIPEVKAVHQPFTSFGGAPTEQDAQFYTRVSERLRHKNRALTRWDYERLILEAFPAIYKVKCLPVGSFEDPVLVDQIQIVVIPDIRGKLPFDPFEPKVPADTLLEIQRFVRQHTPALASVAVRNPTYVYLKTRFSVRFRDSGNPGHDRQRLNQDLQQYLSPWAYDQSAEIVLGGRICGNLIVNFVEERPYVDYLAGLQLFTSPDGLVFTDVSRTDSDPEITAGPDSILISVQEHVIDLITEERYVDEYFIGINFMEIELDFKVG
jgi:hypothetical protein